MYMKFLNYTQTDENLFKFSEERYDNSLNFCHACPLLGSCKDFFVHLQT